MEQAFSSAVADKLLPQFREQILAAGRNRQPLRIRGGGTKDWYGQSLQGDIMDTRELRGILSYEPTELVIRALAGTPLADIDAALAEQNQMLAFEPPHFGTGTTVGGVVAAGLSGPRRQAVGATRDFVLGASLLDGHGTLLHFGGQVMKNVAGYDVSRLLAGSLGTLGMIVEVSLKVLPRPFAETTLQLALGQADAITQLNRWGGQPLPISASTWQDGRLVVRLSGAEAAVRAARQKIGGDALAESDANAFWTALREQQADFFTRPGSDALWRFSVPSVAAPLDLPGEQLIEWGGAQRWLRSDADAATLRAAATAARGHATLFRGGDRRAGVFHPLAPAVMNIHRHLKNAFDPHGIFNPGRMYQDF